LEISAIIVRSGVAPMALIDVRSFRAICLLELTGRHIHVRVTVGGRAHDDDRALGEASSLMMASHVP
jgi:hypothetical protein